MINYAVVEIAGRQYFVEPGKQLNVNFLGDITQLNCEKVLMLSQDGKLDVGMPYLKESLIFEVIGQKKDKVRVATYKAKANTRKVIGAKRIQSTIKLQVNTVKNKA